MSVLYNYLDQNGNTTNNPFYTGADGRLMENKYQGRADGGGNGDPSLGMAANGGNYITNDIPTPGAPAPAPSPAPAPAPSGIVGGWAFGSPSPTPSATPTPMPMPGITSGGGIVSSASQYNSYATPGTLGAATPWSITGDQTVAGQIASLTNENSPIMQQARAQAAKDAAARGLSNSSMALTGAQDSVYHAATPIATADAATYAKAAGYNADQQNQNNQLQYTQGNQVGMSREQNATALQQAGISANTALATNAANNAAGLQQSEISAATARYTAQLNSQTQQVIKSLDAQSQAQLNAEHDKNAAILQTSSAASNAFNQYATQMQNIQLSTTMDAAAKTQALKNIRDTYTFAMQAAYKLSSAQLPDFSSLLDFDAVPGGVTAGSSAPAPAGGSFGGSTTGDYGTGNGGA